MTRTYTRRGLRCPFCGKPLKVRLTSYRNGAVVRYRYCAGCDQTFKTVETLAKDFTVKRLARGIRNLLGKK